MREDTSSPQRAAIRYALARAGKGVCISCGCNVDAEAAVWPRCRSCRLDHYVKYTIKSKRKGWAASVNKSVCYRHPERSSINGWCEECLEKQRVLHRKLKASRISQNMCTKCGKHAPESGRKNCRSCLDRVKANRQSGKVEP